MAQASGIGIQDNFYQSAISAGIAVGITAIIGFVCFMIFGSGIQETMQWVVTLCLVSGGATFAGVAVGMSAGAKRGRSLAQTP